MSGMAMAGLMKSKSLTRAVLLVLWCTCVYGLLEILMTSGSWWWSSRQAPGTCKADNEGQWAIGIYKGPSPFQLQPLELARPRVDAVSAWPAANPVYTCAHVQGSSFVADPFIWPSSDGKFMVIFYETKSLHNMQGDIGAAVSNDGGVTFNHVGVVLDEPWHLSYPFVVKDNGTMYMIPEGSKSGELRLYVAKKWPSEWAFERVLIDQPLIDASFLQHDGKWWLFASNRREKSSRNCRELEVWFANHLVGPWTRHPQSPVRSWAQGSRMAGRPIKSEGQLYRFGQECEYTYGYKLRAFRIKALTSESYEEEEVPFAINGTRRPGVDWNGQRYHHIDAHQLESGQWVAAMDGDRYVSDYLSWRWAARAAVLLPIAVTLAAASAALFFHLGGLAPLLDAASSFCQRCCCCFCGAPRDVESPHSSRKRRPSSSFSYSAVYSFLTGDPAARPVGGSPTFLSRAYEVLALRLPLPLPLLPPSGGCSLGQLLLAAMLTATAVWLLLWFVWTYCRLQILAGLLWYVRTWSGSPEPVLVNGTYSKFSVIVMSYEARLITLQAFVRHYSQCSSVGEIVVVWNKGAPPDPTRDLHSTVPVRVRAEAVNSMNNRFRPDPELFYRGVLMLDDDIIMPCADIERGFSKWRRHPERVTGFYSRILEGDPPQYQCIYGCEKYTYDKGVFNIVLAGAAFMDSELVFPTYFSSVNEQGRAYVDRVFNCDDLLLNYLMAHHLKGKQYAEYVRPTKRFDVGKLTSKRLSTGNFGPVRHNCTRDFAAMFGNPLKDVAFPINWDGLGKPTCGPAWLGCLFI